MFKNSVSIIFLGSLIATSSYAFNLVDKLKINKKLHTVRSAISLEDNKKFTDFSGVWTGTCSHAEGEITTTIRNDATTIELDGEEVAINFLKTESLSGKPGTNFSHESYFWNSDRTKLIFRSTDIVKANSSYPMTIVLTGSMSLNNNQLILGGDVDLFADVANKAQNTNFTCTFNKSTESQ